MKYLLDKKVLQTRNGFTMVEILVASTLFLLVSFVIINFMITSGNFFNLNTDKADAQSQARLIFQGITKELSTAKEVQVVDTSPSGILAVPAGKVGYKVKDNLLVSVDGNTGDERPAFNNTALKSLDFQFAPQSDKLLKIIMTANESAAFETDVYSPNIVSFEKSPSGLTTGDAIVITP